MGSVIKQLPAATGAAVAVTPFTRAHMPTSWHVVLACPQVLVHGSPRRWAHAKHCQWVLDRRQLEAAKPPGCSEVLLLDDQGHLVEGLASNFYVVTGGW